jgi:hypothetical protein
MVDIRQIFTSGIAFVVFASTRVNSFHFAQNYHNAKFCSRLRLEYISNTGIRRRRRIGKQFACHTSLRRNQPVQPSSLHMHMGHSHAHHDHDHHPNNNGSMTQEQPSHRWQFVVMRRRRLIAMIVFCAVAIFGPPFVLRQPHQIVKQQLQARFAAFLVTTSAIVAAEPIRNYILSTIERIRLLGAGISKHSTPITASYLFQNKNAADRITLLG